MNPTRISALVILSVNLIFSCPTQGAWPYISFGAVAVSENYCYLGWQKEIYILDVSDPSSPKKVAQMVFPDVDQGAMWKFFIDGKLLYVAQEILTSGKFSSEVRIVDIANPSTPKEVGSYRTDSRPLSIFVLHSYAYIVTEVEGLKVLDISNPSLPAEAGSYPLIHPGWDIFVSGNYAYVANGVERGCAL